jgi:hypothetical protein
MEKEASMSTHVSLGSLACCVAVVAALTAGLSLMVGAKAMSSPPMNMTKVSGPYRITLIIGPAETMSVSMNGNATERVISGKNATCQMAMHMDMLLSGVAATKMQACNAHVEVHAYHKSNGKVVSNAAVTIVLVAKGTHGSPMTVSVPIMKMEGMNAGPSDLHYGNNIYIAAGKYTVKVAVNGVKANFAVTITRGM